MNRVERLGFKIVVAWHTAAAALLLLFCAAFPVRALVIGSDGAWMITLSRLFVFIGIGFLALRASALDFRAGRAGIRWYAAVVCAFAATILFGTAWRMVHPQPGLEIDDPDPSIAPGVIGLATGWTTAGLLLLAPPVADFLSYRRRLGAVGD